MSPDLAEYINALPIKTFLLSSDMLVIGRVVENRVESIEVKSLCVIDTLYAEDNSTMRQVILPMVPANFDQSSTIARRHVVVETPASLLLKKSYCDALLAAKVQTEMHGSNQINQSDSIDLETTKPKGLTDKQWKERWNN